MTKLDVNPYPVETMNSYDQFYDNICSQNTKCWKCIWLKVYTILNLPFSSNIVSLCYLARCCWDHDVLQRTFREIQVEAIA